MWLKQAVLITCALDISSRLAEVSGVKSDNLEEDCNYIDRLTCHKSEEYVVIAHTHTTIDPGAMVIIAFDAPTTHIAVIAPRQHDYLALKADFVNRKSL